MSRAVLFALVVDDPDPLADVHAPTLRLAGVTGYRVWQHELAWLEHKAV